MAGTHSTQGNQGAGNLKDKAEQTGANLGATAGRKVGDAAEKAQQSATSATQKAQDLAANVGQRAQELAGTAAERTDEALTAMGGRMTSWGSTLRESAPREGMVGSAASGVAGTLEAGGRYLQQHDLNDMTDDVAGVIRNYPIQSLLVAFGLGCFLGMTSRR